MEDINKIVSMIRGIQDKEHRIQGALFIINKEEVTTVSNVIFKLKKILDKHQIKDLNELSEVLDKSIKTEKAYHLTADLLQQAHTFMDIADDRPAEFSQWDVEDVKKEIMRRVDSNDKNIPS